MKQYPTPAAFKMALEERIRTLARQQGEDMNRLRQMLIFDRIVARISFCRAKPIAAKTERIQ